MKRSTCVIQEEIFHLNYPRTGLGSVPSSSVERLTLLVGFLVDFSIFYLHLKSLASCGPSPPLNDPFLVPHQHGVCQAKAVPLRVG